MPLEDMSLNLTLNYDDALKTAIDMKEQERLFQDMQTMADLNLQDLKEATDNEIEGTTELQANCTAVSNDGFDLIGVVAKFAETMLQLAERQDELIVAQEDLERATEQVLFSLQNILRSFQGQ